MVHEGPAIVFDSYPEMKGGGATTPTWTSPPTTSWSFAMPGPSAGPGMPEWGMLPIPTRLVKQGRCATCCASRTPDVRDILVRVRPACSAGIGHRRSAGIGPDRRPHPRRRAKPDDRPDGCGRRTGDTGGPHGRRPNRMQPAVYNWMFAKHIMQPTRAATSTIWKPASAGLHRNRTSSEADATFQRAVSMTNLLSLLSITDFNLNTYIEVGEVWLPPNDIQPHLARYATDLSKYWR